MKKVSSHEFYRAIFQYQRLVKLTSDAYADLYCVSVNWMDNDDLVFRLVTDDEGNTEYFIK